MTFKEKIIKFKAVLSNFDKLEKNVQVQLMAVADRMAPKVQGGNIAPQTMNIPEPIEYPDITKKPIGMLGKHVFDNFIEAFQKGNWKPGK